MERAKERDNGINKFLKKKMRPKEYIEASEKRVRKVKLRHKPLQKTVNVAQSHALLTPK